MVDTFERSVWLATRVETAFLFHLDPANIRKIAPPSLRVVELEQPDSPRVGSTIRLKVRQFGVTQLWEVVWDIIEPPAGQPARARLVDRALRSPFAVWRHEHAFREDVGGCWMTDRIEFRLPLAPWSAPARPFVCWALRHMFEERHRRTAAYFTTDQPSPPDSALGKDRTF